VREVGATDERLRKALAAAPPRARSIVCIVDSGLEQAHPEYVNTTGGGSGTSSLSLSGCSGSPACPYEWSKDVVGHGSHVAGTIAAPRNGVGVVGVMGGGAEVHVVRVWNDSGDVSQGQGPYATDLVLAYTNCLNHLKAEQARDPRARVNMVLNLSFGSAGPLTVERAWIERAAKRGDMLFVGSSGNNGSFLDVARRSGGPASLRGSGGSEVVGQYFSYPASYALDEVRACSDGVLPLLLVSWWGGAGRGGVHAPAQAAWHGPDACRAGTRAAPAPECVVRAFFFAPCLSAAGHERGQRALRRLHRDHQPEEPAGQNRRAGHGHPVQRATQPRRGARQPRHGATRGSRGRVSGGERRRQARCCRLPVQRLQGARVVWSCARRLPGRQHRADAALTLAPRCRVLRAGAAAGAGRARRRHAVAAAGGVRAEAAAAHAAV
jgi:hypothetical protein